MHLEWAIHFQFWGLIHLQSGQSDGTCHFLFCSVCFGSLSLYLVCCSSMRPIYLLPWAISYFQPTDSIKENSWNYMGYSQGEYIDGLWFARNWPLFISGKFGFETLHYHKGTRSSNQVNKFQYLGDFRVFWSMRGNQNLVQPFVSGR